MGSQRVGHDCSDLAAAAVSKLPRQKQGCSCSRARRRAGYVLRVLSPGAAFFHCNGYETCSRNTGRGLHVLMPLGFLAPSLMSAAARPAQSPLCLVACLLTVLHHLRFREAEIDKGQKRWERKRRETILNGKGTKSKPATRSVFILFQLRKETFHSLKKYFFHVPWPSIAIPVKHY